MAQINNLLPILEEAVLDADIHRLNFNNFKSKYNQHDINKVGVHGLVDTEEVGSVKYYNDLLDSVNPVGTIVTTWDNSDATIMALVNTGYYKIMNGDTITDVDSPFYNKVLPDLSERYLCLTKNSGSVDGSISGSFTIDIEHTHSYSHYHGFDHYHTVGAHTHYNTSTSAAAGIGMSSSYVCYLSAGVVPSWTADERAYNLGSPPGGSSAFYGTRAIVQGSSYDYGHFQNGYDNSTSTYASVFNDQLSSSQSIKPRSIKVRFFLRYK